MRRTWGVKNLMSATALIWANMVFLNTFNSDVLSTNWKGAGSIWQLL